MDPNSGSDDDGYFALVEALASCKKHLAKSINEFITFWKITRQLHTDSFCQWKWTKKLAKLFNNNRNYHIWCRSHKVKVFLMVPIKINKRNDRANQSSFKFSIKNWADMGSVKTPDIGVLVCNPNTSSNACFTFVSIYIWFLSVNNPIL